MATLEHEPSPPLPPAVRSQLDALRGRIVRYVWLEGLAALAVWIGLWFWASMAIDWLFEPPRPIRAAVLAIAGLGLAAALFMYILRRAFVRLNDISLAMLLERRFPALNDSLLTSVSLADRSPEQAGFNPRMLARTSQIAQRQLGDVRVADVFNPMPLTRKIVIALGLAAMVGALAYQSPGVLDLWAQRNLLLANKLWPRKIRLEVVGFNNGMAKVAAGSNFDLRVRAFRGDTEVPVLPDNVEIRYRSEGSRPERKTMKTIGAAIIPTSRSDDVLQEYSYQFNGLLATHHFDIIGGDAYLHDYVLEVVPNPSLKLSMLCEYPAYMERTPTTIELGTDAVPVPVGCWLTVHGVASKALESLRIDSPAAGNRAAWQRDFSGDALGDGRTTFSYRFQPFPAPAAKKGDADAKPDTQSPQDCALLFTLCDADGIKSRDPIHLSLVAVPDERPDVKVRLVGTQEPVVTQKGRLPVTGKITDDHGLGRVWFDYTIAARSAAKPPADSTRNPEEVASPPAGKRSGEAPLGKVARNTAEYSIKEEAVEASALKLNVGENLTLAVRAADLCNLGAGPNVGSSETWQLAVVSEDELLTRLESRELLLRQRFEATLQQMTETRNLLLRMDFTPAGKTPSKPPKTRQAGAEPGDLTADAPQLSAADLASRRLERTLQALQNCHQNALETAEVAAGVDEIRLQLTNNRVESEERKTRLEANVSRPLHRIVDEMFPYLGARLEALQPLVGDLTAGPVRRDDALKEADAILAQMREVLSHMIAMEDFNVAVVQRLQKLIERQKELTHRTIKTDHENLEKD